MDEGHSTCYHGCWMVREQAVAAAAPNHSWTACYHALWQPLFEALTQPFRLEPLVAYQFSYHSGHCFTMSTPRPNADEFISGSFECRCCLALEFRSKHAHCPA